jgi:hypothetical protein
MKKYLLRGLVGGIIFYVVLVLTAGLTTYVITGDGVDKIGVITLLVYSLKGKIPRQLAAYVRLVS